MCVEGVCICGELEELSGMHSLNASEMRKNLWYGSDFGTVKKCVKGLCPSRGINIL